MKPRVAILTEIIAPYRVPVFNALAKIPAIDPYIVFLSETDASLREWRVPGDDIQFVYDVLPNWRRRIAGYNILLNWGLYRQLERISPDILICGGYSYLASWQAASWCARNNVPLVLWSESTAHDQRRRWPAVEVLKKRFLRKCDGCVVPGKSSFEYLSALHVPQRRISVAPDAVDNSFFANRAGAARAQERHHRLALDLPERFFLFVGRLIAAKGVFDLLEAYAALPWEVRSEVGLVFVGNGDARTELQRRARSIQPGCIQFSGFVQKDQLPVYYGLADTFVFPTHTDPWGLVVNEAMASGLPVISTSVAGCTADLVIEGWNGLVVPAADVRELAAAMEMLARSSELRKQFGARSAEKIMQNSPEACAQGLADAAFFACRGHA